MSKHEEWLAAFVESGSAESLMHFNDKHDSNGRFAKKNGGSTGSVQKSAKVTPEGHLSVFGMYTKNIPKDAYTYTTPDGVYRSVGTARNAIVTNMAKSLLSQSRSTSYGNNLLAPISPHNQNQYQNTMAMRQALHAQLMSAYMANVKDPELLPQNSEDQYILDQLVWTIGNEELAKEIERQGKANMPNEMAVANAKAARAEKKKGAKLTLQDRINAAYKEASNANANRPSASIQTLKGKLSGLVDKVSSSAKSGKDKTASLVSKGKKYLDNAFTSTSTEFHTQAEKLKQKKKSLLTKTKYDTSSYKNT